MATHLLHIGTVNGFNVESILIATSGAVAVPVVMRLATRESSEGRDR